MTDIGRVWMWASLAAIATLIVLSIVGAFLGAEAAGRMFNSWPLAVGWFALAALLVGALALYPSLIRRGGPLAMHLGMLAVLAGGMWGAPAGHKLRGWVRKPGKVYTPESKKNAGPKPRILTYLTILTTAPAPTVLPPSRTANRSCSSRAIGD